MILELRLQNFQPHKTMRLQFSPGLNVIVGPTDRGKSSVCRALRFIALHESASGLVSHGETSLKVGVLTPEGVVSRFKDSKKYGYKAKGEEFLACAKEQPKQVSDMLMLSDVNFQAQFDPHFLISLTPGQVAKEINKIVALEDIDLSITWLKSRESKLGVLMESNAANIEHYKQELTKYDSLESELALLNQIREVLDKLNLAEKRKATVAQFVSQVIQIDTDILAKDAKITATEILLAKASEIDAARTRKQALESLLADSRAVESLPKLNAAIAALERLVGTIERRDLVKKLISEEAGTTFQISDLFSRIQAKLASGSSIVDALTKRLATIKEIVATVASYKEAHGNLASQIAELEGKIAVAETPYHCTACGKCVRVCE
jgi:DNA repair protein SbcC/Rad50